MTKKSDEKFNVACSILAIFFLIIAGIASCLTDSPTEEDRAKIRRERIIQEERYNVRQEQKALQEAIERAVIRDEIRRGR